MNGKITAQDRAIIILSVNYTLSSQKQREQTGLLEEMGSEMFKKQPHITLHDIPVLYQAVQAFYASLVREGTRESDAVRHATYGEVLQQCEELLDKIKDICELRGIELGYKYKH